MTVQSSHDCHHNRPRFEHKNIKTKEQLLFCPCGVPSVLRGWVCLLFVTTSSKVKVILRPQNHML
jgi:hypothetical protein